MIDERQGDIYYITDKLIEIMLHKAAAAAAEVTQVAFGIPLAADSGVAAAAAASELVTTPESAAAVALGSAATAAALPSGLSAPRSSQSVAAGWRYRARTAAAPRSKGGWPRSAHQHCRSGSACRRYQHHYRSCPTQARWA